MNFCRKFIRQFFNVSLVLSAVAVLVATIGGFCIPGMWWLGFVALFGGAVLVLLVHGALAMYVDMIDCIEDIRKNTSGIDASTAAAAEAAAKPSAPPIGNNVWVCPECGEINGMTRQNCVTCGCQTPIKRTEELIVDNEQINHRELPNYGLWICPTCKELNGGTRTKCVTCGLVRDVTYSRPIYDPRNEGGYDNYSSEAVWSCSNCGELNGGTRSKCVSCGTDREPAPSINGVKAVAVAPAVFDDTPVAKSDDESAPLNFNVQAEAPAAAADIAEAAPAAPTESVQAVEAPEQSKQWFCSKCGTKCEADGLFCIVCGNKRSGK